MDLRVWTSVSIGAIFLTAVAATVFYQGKKRIDKYSGHKLKMSNFFFGSQKDYPV